MPEILVAIDDSPHSKAVLQWALEQAERWGQSLKVLAVCVTPLDVLGIPIRPDPDQVEKTRRTAQAVLEEEIGRRGKEPTVPVTVETDYGSPVDSILAHGEKASQIVIGARGVRAFSRLLLGSVSQAVVHHATRPVTVVPTVPLD